MTIDEVVRFVEHCAGLGLVAIGAAERVYPPLVIRSIELGAFVGAALMMLFLGLWLGNVEGAAGAALIAAAGSAVTIAVLRYYRTRETWESTDERFAKG